jgi:hypothetical protein
LYHFNDSINIILDDDISIETSNQDMILLHNSSLLISYKCSPSRTIGIYVFYKDSNEKEIVLFNETWKCDNSIPISIQTEQLTYQVHTKRINIKLTNDILYRPHNLLNKKYYPDDKLNLKMFLIDSLVYRGLIERKKKMSKLFDFALIKKEFIFKIIPPYSRPSITGDFYINIKHQQSNVDNQYCDNFDGQITSLLEKYLILTCSYQQEVVNIVQFPLVLNSAVFVKYFKLEKYSNQLLENERLKSFNDPKYDSFFFKFNH